MLGRHAPLCPAAPTLAASGWTSGRGDAARVLPPHRAALDGQAGDVGVSRALPGSTILGRPAGGRSTARSIRHRAIAAPRAEGGLNRASAQSGEDLAWDQLRARAMR